MAALHSWLSAQCDGFLNRGSVVPPTTDIDVPEAASVATNPLNTSTSLPSSPRLVDNQVPPSTVSPFSLAAPPVPTQNPAPPVVSNPFVDLHPNTESSHSGPPSFSEGGPVRLTRLVEMSLDTYYATVNEMIAAGRFEHIGHASIRVEGTTAWGVWLRVDQWPTALGRHPRLRCGVLYHVANRTLSFHGIARDAVQFLLPLFQDWTYSSLPQLPSIRSSGARVEIDRPQTSGAVPQRPSPFSSPGRPQSGGVVPQRPTAVLSPPSDNHSSTGIAGSTPSEVSVLRGLVHQLVDVCQSNQQQLSLLRGEVSQLRDELRAVRAAPGAPSSQAASVPPTRVPTRVSGAPHSQSDATCRFAGCSQQVSARCPVQFCRAHCTSSRCPVHTGRSPSRSRQCRSNGCTTVVPRSCTSGFCEAHCTSQRCRLHRGPVCSSRGCGEVPSPGCVVGMCETHCNHPQCSPPAPRLHLPPLSDVIRTAVS